MIQGTQSRVDCKPYHCDLSAASCAARHQKAHQMTALVERRKGVHLRGADLRGCFNCATGAYVVRRLGEIAARRAEAEGEGEEPAPAVPRRWIRPFARRKAK